MTVIDAHCDVLSKLLTHPSADLDDETKVDATLPRMIDGEWLLQIFAIYIPRRYAPTARLEQLWRSVDLFHQRIAARPQFTHVRRKSDLIGLQSGERIGALLSLEGVDGLPSDPLYLRLLHQLGLRALGLTWNDANWAADGAGEPRGAGLTAAGKKYVKECEQLGILLDVSHLSDQAFWDAAELVDRPLIASHSNVRDLCPHPRNLCVRQIDHLIHTQGMIGITFVPSFVHESGTASIDDLIMHIEYICARGGANMIGFGSDYDGIDKTVAGLEHPGKIEHLREALMRHYSEELIEQWMHKNWYTFLNTHLPE